MSEWKTVPIALTATWEEIWTTVQTRLDRREHSKIPWSSTTLYACSLLPNSRHSVFAHTRLLAGIIFNPYHHVRNIRVSTLLSVSEMNLRATYLSGLSRSATLHRVWMDLSQLFCGPNCQQLVLQLTMQGLRKADDRGSNSSCWIVAFFRGIGTI